MKLKMHLSYIKVNQLCTFYINIQRWKYKIYKEISWIFINPVLFIYFATPAFLVSKSNIFCFIFIIFLFWNTEHVKHSPALRASNTAQQYGWASPAEQVGREGHGADVPFLSTVWEALVSGALGVLWEWHHQWGESSATHSTLRKETHLNTAWVVLNREQEAPGGGRFRKPGDLTVSSPIRRHAGCQEMITFMSPPDSDTYHGNPVPQGQNLSPGKGTGRPLSACWARNPGGHWETDLQCDLHVLAHSPKQKDTLQKIIWRITIILWYKKRIK